MSGRLDLKGGVTSPTTGRLVGPFHTLFLDMRVFGDKKPAVSAGFL